MAGIRRRTKGRGFLILIRVGSALATLLFVGLLVTTVLMAIPGNLEFIPPGDSPSFRYEDGVVFLDTNFTIGNRGYHDITNLSFTVQAVVEDQIVVTDYRTPPVNIPTGERRVVEMSIPIRLEPLQSSGYIVLRPANITFRMGIAGTTTRNLLDFAVAFSFQEYFEALIPFFDIGWENSTLTPTNGDFRWEVPYVVGMAPFLQGQATADFTLSNETGVVANATEVLQLGGVWQDNLTFFLDNATANELLTTPQVMTLEVVLTLPGDVTFTHREEILVDLGG
jgi:hypothetical protein